MANRMNHYDRTERLLGRFFLILVSAAFCLFLLDRTPLAERPFALKDIRHPSPYVMFKGPPHAKAWYKYSSEKGLEDNVLNALGYPGDAPAMPKPATEYRIIVLGGSTAFMGNPAIPRLIQYQFERNSCPNVKVYNFSVVSSVSSMDLARLVFEAVDYAPDLIISYTGFNDIDQPLVADPRPGYPFNYFIYESNPILDSDVRDYPLLPLIAYGSPLLRRFFPSAFLHAFADLETLRKEAGFGTERWRERIADIFVENMSKSHKIARAFGADFMAFLQPSLYFKNLLTEKERGFIDEKRRTSARTVLSLIQKNAKKIVDHDGVDFTDLSGFFTDRTETIYEDRVHLNYRYRPVVAKRIFARILEKLNGEQAPTFLPAACLNR